jgi:protein SYS1
MDHCRRRSYTANSLARFTPDAQGCASPNPESHCLRSTLYITNHISHFRVSNLDAHGKRTHNVSTAAITPISTHTTMPPGVRRRKPPPPGSLTELPPLRIIRSIVLLQLAYYAIATILILFTMLVAGQKFSLALVFDWRTVRGDNTVGWMLGVVWLMGALFAYVFPGYVFEGFLLTIWRSVIVLLLLISRSKLIPDFALTLHFLHLVITSLYTRRIPTNLLWWLLQAGSAGIMISLGVWACRYRELRPISFGLGSASNKEGSTKTEGGGNAVGEMGPEDGHVRGGRGRGRNRDEGPSYEMVAVKEENGEAV